VASEVARFKVNGELYEMSPGDFTAVDAGDFRRQMGISLGEAFSSGQADIDIVAALVWLVRRRTNRGLAFRAVAETITYDSIEPADDTEPAPAADPMDPEG
jgi:hypothetical protein